MKLTCWSGWLLLPFVVCSKFLVNKELRDFGDHQKCPNGFKLADLNEMADWNLASQLAIEILGPDKMAWINSGWMMKGSGYEQWTLLTPIPKHSCEFPPKDLKSFCLPIYWPRMSPNFTPGIKLPSICQSQEIKN